MAAAWAAACAPAAAQQITQERSAALACLEPKGQARGLPAYDAEARRRGRTGHVKVVLDFVSPDAEPRVEVVESRGEGEFVNAVREHVRAYRVPCLAAIGGRARLEFEFVFQLEDAAVVPRAPIDRFRADEQRMIACVVNTSGKPTPDYPLWAERQGFEGRVVARVRFEASDRAPATEIVSRRRADDLQQAVEAWLAQQRMPCHAGAPVTYMITFVFRIEGNKAFGFRDDLPFRDWIGMLKRPAGRPLVADTTTMGCPFRVSLHYLQPAMPNDVREIGSYHPARLQVLDWLARGELALTPRLHDAAFGDTLTLTIPCAKIDLGPKE